MAIQLTKVGKVAVPVNISMEALKSDVEVTAKMFHTIFRKIWEKGQIPANWKEGYLISIPKRDPSKCENYRGIKLLSVPAKVFNSVVEPNERFSR